MRAKKCTAQTLGAIISLFNLDMDCMQFSVGLIGYDCQRLSAFLQNMVYIVHIAIDFDFKVGVQQYVRRTKKELHNDLYLLCYTSGLLPFFGVNLYLSLLNSSFKSR